MTSLPMHAGSATLFACAGTDFSREGEQRDVDLSYWSDLGESYQPEWFPLGMKLEPEG